MNRAPSPHPSPPMGERVAEGEDTALCRFSEVHGPDLATAGVCLFTSYSPAGVNNLRLTTVLVASMCEFSRL